MLSTCFAVYLDPIIRHWYQNYTWAWWQLYERSRNV